MAAAAATDATERARGRDPACAPAAASAATAPVAREPTVARREGSMALVVAVAVAVAGARGEARSDFFFSFFWVGSGALVGSERDGVAISYQVTARGAGCFGGFPLKKGVCAIAQHAGF